MNRRQILHAVLARLDDRKDKMKRGIKAIGLGEG